MTAVIVIVVALAVIVAAIWWSRQRAIARQQQELEDAKAEARRWVERLGGQVLNLIGTNEAAKQALADASERHNAAASQLEQAKTATQCRLTTETALEGLYYVRAARTAMDMDPGPELPDLNGQRSAGRVTEFREVEVEGLPQDVARAKDAWQKMKKVRDYKCIQYGSHFQRRTFARKRSPLG